MIYDPRDTVYPLADVMRVFRHPEAKIPLTNGKNADYIASRRFSIPVNKENVIKYGILDKRYEDMIPSEIVLEIPKGKDGVTKPELFFLDLLSNYEWDRPLNFLNAGGDIQIGIKDYLMYEGFSFKFVPIKNKMSSSEIGFSDPDDLYHKMKNVFTWDALKRPDYFIDYHNNYTFCGVLSQRQLFVNVAKELIEAGENEKALEMLDMCQECVPEKNFPLDMSYLGFNNEIVVSEMIQLYYELGAEEKGRELMERFTSSLNESLKFFSKFETTQREYATVMEYLLWMLGICQD